MKDTQFGKALSGEVIIGDPVENIEICREIANELKVTNVIDPSSRQIGLLAELIVRVREIPEFEILDIEGEA